MKSYITSAVTTSPQQQIVHVTYKQNSYTYYFQSIDYPNFSQDYVNKKYDKINIF